MPEQEVSTEEQPKGRILYVGFDMDGTIRNSIAGYTVLFGKLMHDKYGIDAEEAGNHFINTAGQPTPEQISTLLLCVVRSILVSPALRTARSNPWQV